MSGQSQGQAPTLTVSEEEKEKMRQQLAAADSAASGGPVESGLDKALEAKHARDIQESLGLDLDFDPHAFITKGVIVKKGIKVGDNVYVDMKTLTTKERMLAEAMVRDKFGNMRMDAVYLTAIEAAMMAVSITRINNQPFDNPDVGKPMTDLLNKALHDGKLQLFNMFMDSSNELVTMLSVVYKNLEAVSVPTEAVQKKS